MSDRKPQPAASPPPSARPRAAGRVAAPADTPTQQMPRVENTEAPSAAAAPASPPRQRAAAKKAATAKAPRPAPAKKAPTPDPADAGRPEQLVAPTAAAPMAAAAIATEKQAKSKPKPAQETERKARLRLVRLDPWSVMKTAFALSIALAIVMVVAVTIVWAVLGVAGVWDAINSSVATLLSENADAFDVNDYVGFGRIIGLTIVISAIDVILITAIATIGAFLYNLAASLLGGLEVTLAEGS